MLQTTPQPDAGRIAAILQVMSSELGGHDELTPARLSEFSRVLDDVATTLMLAKAGRAG